MWKTLWEKEKLLVTSNFSFFHIVFYPIRHLFFFHFECTWNCRLQFVSFWTCLKSSRLVIGYTKPCPTITSVSFKLLYLFFIHVAFVPFKAVYCEIKKITRLYVIAQATQKSRLLAGWSLMMSMPLMFTARFTSTFAFRVVKILIP